MKNEQHSHFNDAERQRNPKERRTRPQQTPARNGVRRKGAPELQYGHLVGFNLLPNRYFNPP